MQGFGKLNQYRAYQSRIGENVPVCFLVYESGGWDLECMNFDLPMNVIQHIQSIKPPCGSSCSDYVEWDDVKEDKFTTKDAYLTLSLACDLDIVQEYLEVGWSQKNQVSPMEDWAGCASYR